MTERPDDLTQPISTDATSEQPPVDAGQPAVDAAAARHGCGATGCGCRAARRWPARP